MKTVTIKNIKYSVIKNITPDGHDEAGCPNLARMMRDNKISNDLYLRRPKGSRIYISFKYENGDFDRPTMIPGSTTSDI